MRQYLTRQNAGFRGINSLLALLLPSTALATPINVTDAKAAPGATDTWYKHQLTLVSA